MIWVVGILSFLVGGVAGVVITAILTASALQDRVEESVNDYIESKEKEDEER